MPEMPKIMIGVPGFAGIVPEAQESMARLVFRCGRDLPQYDFALEVITKREQFRARNQLVDAAIASGCDYLLMLDDDIIVPPDLVERLLRHGKDVIGALYWQRGGAYNPVVMRQHTHENGEMAFRFLDPFDPVITQPGLHPVDIIGGGCMLFCVDIFRKLTPPYFWWEATLGTDIAICTRLKEAGVQVWIDTSIELGHVSERQIITGKSIPLGAQELGATKEALWQDVVAYLGMPPAELESACTQASYHQRRQALWEDQPRDTWEQVRAFYTSYGEWHILNLLYWAMSKRDQLTEWLFTQSQRWVSEGDEVLDLGPGLGLESLFLARKCRCRPLLLDLAGTPTLEFVRWRRQRHAMTAAVALTTFTQPVPELDWPERFQAALLLSMLDHCWDAYGTLLWTIRQLKPGGILVCDYYHGAQRDTEPQHLMRYDPTTLPQWLREHGLEQAPDLPWLFKKRGD